MDEINQFSNQNTSSKNTDEIINKIQNSLDRLQSAINNKQIFDNNNSKNNIPNQNINIRKRTIDSKNISRKNNPSLTEENLSNLLFDNNHSMVNNNTVFNTDKRIIQKKVNQNRILNNFNMDNNINRNIEYIIPRSTQGRYIQYNKINYNTNYNSNYNRNRNINNTLMRKKCFNCGNINPPRSKFCFNCGISLNNINNINMNNQYNTFNQRKNTNNNLRKPNNNNFSTINSNKDMNIENITESQTIQTEKEFNINNNNINNNINQAKPKNSNKDIISPRNNKIMNNIYADLNDIQNEDSINYKKLNDLYLYGDYLENELKASNDENIKLLEKYKAAKIQVHSLNQKKNKIKQNIDILSKKEKDLTKLNEELKNGFSFTQQKLGNNENNEEKVKILNELELNNKKYIEKQNEYEKEIENLKKQITLLVDNEEEEENDEDEKMIKNLENDIEKRKKELEEKNDEYTLLIKQNEKLNQEIKYLAKELDLNLSENEGEENYEEEEEEKEDNNINNDKNKDTDNKSKEKENIDDNLNKSENEEKKEKNVSENLIKENNNIKENMEEKNEIKENNTDNK